jgi:hypothetical protein
VHLADPSGRIAVRGPCSNWGESSAWANDSIANKNLVLNRIAEAEMLIGIIVDPEFREEDKHFACIWSLAERLNAVVFSGEAMLNAQGARLLNQAGETDVLL